MWRSRLRLPALGPPAMHSPCPYPFLCPTLEEQHVSVWVGDSCPSITRKHTSGPEAPAPGPIRATPNAS